MLRKTAIIVRQPLDGNGNFRLCSHAVGKVFMDEFSLYFVLVFIVDEEYKKISKQPILWVKLISHILTVKNNKLIRHGIFHFLELLKCSLI